MEREIPGLRNTETERGMRDGLWLDEDWQISSAVGCREASGFWAEVTKYLFLQERNRYSSPFGVEYLFLFEKE